MTKGELVAQWADLPDDTVLHVDDAHGVSREVTSVDRGRLIKPGGHVFHLLLFSTEADDE